ncbi:hypothetical protein BC937DRAFT_92981 [Endogone sp. FLAS-F59071]|nr:hypothetical protein BC937DRAFT_92981 [Endogone sp. FLAS-F59071]|eukprot:RUS15036.1 hypothetical protein BC937DRAFT_92981 [Endogone sp. FLAS-F59071]
MTTETTNPYEAERQKRIAENLELMRSLGLEKIVEERPKLKPQRKAPSAHPKRTPKITIPKRRSTRVQGKEVAYEVLDHDPLDADFVAKPKLYYSSFREGESAAVEATLVVVYKVGESMTLYSGPHAISAGGYQKLLGSVVSGWVIARMRGRIKLFRVHDGKVFFLFSFGIFFFFFSVFKSFLIVDGCVYRQKTVEEKVQCTNILSNGLCGLMLDERCLVGRYGANRSKTRVRLESGCAQSGSPSWFKTSLPVSQEPTAQISPRCRGNCNCSFCRRKSGLAPTGQLAPLARQNGFAGVSEYLEQI